MDLITPPPSTSLLQPRPGSKTSHWTGLEPELLDRTGLLSELQHFLSDPKGPPAGPSQEELRYPGSPAKAGKVPGVSRQPPPPRIDKLLFRSGATRPRPQDSLSSVDGKDFSLSLLFNRKLLSVQKPSPLQFHCPVSFLLLPPFPERFIQGVVKKLGQQSVNVDALTPSDLDRLSDVITQALQEADDGEGVRGREVTVGDESEMKRGPGAQGQLGKTSGGELAPEGTPHVRLL